MARSHNTLKAHVDMGDMVVDRFRDSNIERAGTKPPWPPHICHTSVSSEHEISVLRTLCRLACLMLAPPAFPAFIRRHMLISGDALNEHKGWAYPDASNDKSSYMQAMMWSSR